MVDDGHFVDRESPGDVDHPFTCLVLVHDFLPRSSRKLAVTTR
jgi:hypothetical protein